MRAAVLALALTLSGCFTTLGAGAGAGIGFVAGNPLKGALIGGVLGLRADLEMMKSLRDLGDFLIFWN